MRIRTKELSYQKVQALPRPEHRHPVRPSWFARTMLRLIALPAQIATRFSVDRRDLDVLDSQPCLILMNHSCFLDSHLVMPTLYPRPFCIVTTKDSFVGKGWVMRTIGCIPTHKFVSDLTLISDIRYALTNLKTHVLMYPEASYTLDGRSTRLPSHLGVLLKRMRVPVMMITTWGAFTRAPLYRGRKGHQVPVKAEMRCLLTAEEVRSKSIEELDDVVAEAFSFDQYAWQRDSGTVVDYPQRAEGISRLLYQCPACTHMCCMEAAGAILRCTHCSKEYRLEENGQMRALTGETEFPHIPHWVDWEREQVRQELLNGTYRMELDVDIGMLVDYKAMYMVGSGRLVQDCNGIVLDGCDGQLHFEQSALSCYSLNVDYNWFKIGDSISIGDTQTQYCCFPRQKDVVTRARLAAEEMYTIAKSR